MNNYDKLQIAEHKIEILKQALRRQSEALIMAGNTEPQLWHSSNEKNSFPIFTRMGNEGMDAIYRAEATTKPLGERK